MILFLYVSFASLAQPISISQIRQDLLACIDQAPGRDVHARAACYAAAVEQISPFVRGVLGNPSQFEAWRQATERDCEARAQMLGTLQEGRHLVALRCLFDEAIRKLEI